MVDSMIGDRIPGSGTSAIPVYYCLTCRDSGLMPYSSKGFPFVASIADGKAFIKCPACDGKSRLCGEVDEPTPTLDALRNMKHGGPA